MAVPRGPRAPADRKRWAAETVTEALTAAERRGGRKKANLLLRHAVHDGLEPLELVEAAVALGQESS
jgi:hypothetical protein